MPDATGANGMRDVARWIIIAVLLVALDQVTKYLAVKLINPDATVPLLPFLSLVLTYNTGAAFSFLAEGSGWQRWFFSLVALGASVLIVWMLYRHRGETFLCVGLTLILAGAVGNLIDRLTLGAVVDFILVYWRQYKWPAFNVADSCISIGAVMLLWDGFFRPRSRVLDR
jgi:signal peptidase II